MSDDDNDLVSVFFGRYFRAEPFFQRLDRPSDLVSSRSCLYQKDIASLYHKLAVKSPESCDVRMDVINQAHFKRVFCKKRRINWLVLVFLENLNILRMHRAEFEQFYCHSEVENMVKFHTVGRNFFFNVW